MHVELVKMGVPQLAFCCEAQEGKKGGFKQYLFILKGRTQHLRAVLQRYSKLQQTKKLNREREINDDSHICLATLN